MAHWMLYDGQIVVELGDGAFSPIATIQNERAARQLLRYAQFAEAVEDMIGAVIVDTLRGTVPCPEASDCIEEIADEAE